LFTGGGDEAFEQAAFRAIKSTEVVIDRQPQRVRRLIILIIRPLEEGPMRQRTLH
jgi:hypothetical protein